MRDAMISALHAWINQRPGMDFRNYGCAKAYRAEYRAILRDKRDAEALLSHVARSSVSADTLREAFRHAFAGRLSWDGNKLDYCTGQYFPTEYRKAACAVMAFALWQHYREGHEEAQGLRQMFRRNFGRGIASRWFS